MTRLILPMWNSVNWEDITIFSHNLILFVFITPVGNYLILNGEEKTLRLSLIANLGMFIILRV